MDKENEEERLELQKNPIKLFWISLFINLSALSSILTLFYIERGLSLIEISILGVVISWTIIVLEVPTGIIADRYGGKKTILSGIFALFIYGIVYIFAKNFFIFIFGIFFLGLSISLLSGCVTSLIYDSLIGAKKEKEAKKYIGNYRSAALIGAIVISPIASIIAKDLINIQFILLLSINLIGYLVAFIISLTLKEVSFNREVKLRKRDIIKKGFSNIIYNKSLRRLTLNHGIGFVAILIFGQIIIQPYLRDAKVPIFLFGILYAIINIILFFIYRISHQIERIMGKRQTLLLTLFIPGILMISLSFITNQYFSIVSYILIAVLIPLRDPLISAYKNVYIESNQRATTISIISMIYSLIAIISQPIIGLIAEINLDYSLIVVGLILILTPIIFRLKESDLKD